MGPAARLPDGGPELRCGAFRPRQAHGSWATPALRARSPAYQGPKLGSRIAFRPIAGAGRPCSRGWPTISPTATRVRLIPKVVRGRPPMMSQGQVIFAWLKGGVIWPKATNLQKAWNASCLTHPQEGL